MGCAQASKRCRWKRFPHLIEVWLLIIVSLLGCFHAPQVAENNEVVSHSKIRPIDIDASTAGRIGHEALEKVGYEEIIRLAENAGFIEYKSRIRIQLASYGSEVTTGFAPVFSRYAVAAAVASQADSPLPGPADVAAVGVIVIGLVDAGLLDGYLLRAVGEILSPSDRAFMAKGKTNADEKAATEESGSQEADIDPNKLHHIFDKEEHALDDFVKSQGGQQKAFHAIQRAANQALREGKLVPGPNGLLPGGDAGPIIDVVGTKIRLIGGRVVNGIVQIASASRKGL